MKRLTLYFVISLAAAFISGCSPAKKTSQPNSVKVSAVTAPEVIIYQTTRNYSEFVPVILSEDKKTIESYPDVKDVYYKGKLAYPTPLHKGYWLDNRGISKNVAFTKLTYEAYSHLTVTPSEENLMKMITDSQPIKRMYSCGKRSSFKDIVSELNAKIDKGDFSGFTRIK
jgi:uncharacterized protein YcfL